MKTRKVDGVESGMEVKISGMDEISARYNLRDNQKILDGRSVSYGNSDGFNKKYDLRIVREARGDGARIFLEQITCDVRKATIAERLTEIGYIDTPDNRELLVNGMHYHARERAEDLAESLRPEIVVEEVRPQLRLVDSCPDGIGGKD